MAKIVEERQIQIVERAPSVGSGPLGVPVHWFEFYGARNSRAWMEGQMTTVPKVGQN